MRLSGGEVHADRETEEDHLLARAMVYDALAQRYGWTVQQIDDTPAKLVLAMMTVAGVRDELEGDRARERARQAGGGQR